MRLMVIAGLLSCFLFAGCAKPKDLEYLGIDHFKILGFGKKESLVGMDAVFYNPNNSKFQFKKAEVDIYINDKYLGKSLLDSLITVPKKDTFYIPVTLNVSMTNFLPNLLSAFSTQSVNVKMDGNVWIKKAGLTLQYPLHYEGKQDIKF